MNRKKVFISYDYDNDRAYKNLLLAWGANKQFDFYIHDHSADISIQSTNDDIIKQAISRKINDASILLCIVGKRTVLSKWVKWEIQKAVDWKKKIVAVKIEKDLPTPNELIGVGANWALSFTYDSISKAINACYL